MLGRGVTWSSPVDLATKAVFERAFYGQPTLHLLADTVRIGLVMNSRASFSAWAHEPGASARFWLFVVGVGGVAARCCSA